MVDKIRELCKKNGTSIFKLEKQLGFGNGIIGRWDKAVPNYERISAVASALGVTVAELTGEADEKGIKKSPSTDHSAEAIDYSKFISDFDNKMLMENANELSMT